MIDREELRALVDHQGGPCVSIFMPAIKAGRETRQNPIRFKNLVDEARARLEEQGMRGPDAERLLRPLTAMIEDQEFWQHQEHGLALFLAPGLLARYLVPIELDELAVVGDRLHVKPLVPLCAQDVPFYLLAFDENNVRLYEGTRFAMRELPHDELPKGVQEVMAERELQPQVGHHPTGPKDTTTGPAWGKRHAFGQNPEDYTRIEIDEFLQRLAKAVDHLMSSRHAPLVLAADGKLQGLYRTHARYGDLLADGVQKHPGGIDEAQLHAAAWRLVEPVFAEARRQAADRLMAVLGGGPPKASTALGDILVAAGEGRVDSLFVADDAHCWGTYDRQRGAVEVHDERRPGDTDLLELAVARTVETSGAIFSVPRREVPLGAVAAALFRY